MPQTQGRAIQRVDLRLYAGDSETFVLDLRDSETGLPVEVSLGEWAAQIKREALDDVLGEFTVTVEGAVPGRLLLSIDAASTQYLAPITRLRWDLQQTFDDYVVVTHAQGAVLVAADVTRVDL